MQFHNTKVFIGCLRVIDKALLEDGISKPARPATGSGQNPNDLYWRIRRAYNYRRMDLLDTLPLYQKLKEEYDPDHPHPPTANYGHDAARARHCYFPAPSTLSQGNTTPSHGAR